MRRRWIVVAALVLAFGCGTAAQAADLREVGMRVDLTLQPLYAGEDIHWNFDLGMYALVAFGAGWAVRASAGFDVMSAGPYAGIGVLRAIGSHLAIEGDLLIQWTFGASTPVAVAGAGARYAGSADNLFYQLAVFPVSWTFASTAGAPAVFSFSPSVTAGGGFIVDTGLEFGEAITVTFHRIPSLAVRPILPIGSGWMLSTRFTSNFGIGF